MCAIAAVTMGAVFAGRSTGLHLDVRLAASLEPETPSSLTYRASAAVQRLADPVPAAIFVVLLVVVCLTCRQRRLAAVAVVGPLTADLIVLVMKHIVGRTIHGSLTFPSTHTTHSAALAMVAAMLIAALLDLAGGATAALALAAAVASSLAMGWALVADSVHYATDTFAGFCVAVSVVALAARGIDLLADRHRSSNVPEQAVQRHRLAPSPTRGKDQGPGPL